MTRPEEHADRSLPLGRLALASAGGVTAIGLIGTAVAAHRAGITAASVLTPAAITSAAFAYGVAYLCMLEPRPAAAWTARIIQLGCVRTAISVTVAVTLTQLLQIRPTVFWTSFLLLTLIGVAAEAFVLAPALRTPSAERHPASHPTATLAGRTSP